MKYQPASDYTDDASTEIDREPHWSSLRASLVTVRAQTVRPALPPRLPPAVQRSAAAPVPPRPAPVYMLPFYSYAESQAQYGLDTERVAPLPMSALRPDWSVALAKLWSRFAAPACGAIAGLIFVVGYLAYSSQSGRAAIAATATHAAPIVMPAIAMSTDAPSDDEGEPPAPAVMVPTVSEVHVAKPVKRAVAGKRIASPKRVATSSSKRRPIRLNDATPLGDLRPSRSR